MLLQGLLTLLLGLDIVLGVKEDDGPPPHGEVARYARYIVHTSNWTTIATTAAQDPIKGFPFANVLSLSDGGLGDWSTGVPYMYLTPMELSAIDIAVDSRASLTMTLAQSGYCHDQGFDDQDPRCGHLILTGSVVTIDSESEEGYIAREALFQRHPDMVDWPESHGWFFCKLDIVNILLLNFYGGPKTIPAEEYFAEESTPIL